MRSIAALKRAQRNKARFERRAAERKERRMRNEHETAHKSAKR